MFLNPLNTARTRHIDLRLKWVIQDAQKGRFHLEHVDTAGMAADGLTKSLQKYKYAQFVRLLGMARFLGQGRRGRRGRGRPGQYGMAGIRPGGGRTLHRVSGSDHVITTNTRDDDIELKR